MDNANRPPDTPRRPMEMSRFGVRISDDYRWLEDPADKGVLDWLREQDTFARAILAQAPGVGSLRSEIGDMLGRDATVRRILVRGRLAFFLRRDAGKDIEALYVVDLAQEAKVARLLVTPEAASPSLGGAATIDYYRVSPSGRLVAVGMSRGGAEAATLRIFDIQTHRWLGDEIPDVMLGALWWLDEASFVYWRPNRVTSSQDPRRYQDTESFLHRVGSPSAEDRAVFGRRSFEIDITTSSFPMVYVTPASPGFVWGFAGPNPKEYDIYVSRWDDMASGKPRWRPVIGREARVGDFVARGSTIYLLTYGKAARGQVVALDVSQPGKEPRVIVPEGEKALQSLSLAKDGLYVKGLDDGEVGVIHYSFQEGTLREMPLSPGSSVSEVATDEQMNGALVLAESWTRSPRLFQYDAQTASIRDTGIVKPSSLGEPDFLVSHAEVDAGDARIPMTVIHQPGLRLDGRNPTKIIAYGSYGYNYVPRFLVQERAWLRRGGVIAFAHVRGGGARGDSWHGAAVGARKVVAVQDFISCAEYLIGQGYTSPRYLIASGASAGGIVIGAGLVRRPELFRAVVLNVPVVSILRFLEKAPTGAVFEFEFGSLQREDDYKALLSLDAYYSIRPDRRYPPVLLMAGMNDPRVPIWQPAKFAAKLQSTPRGRALLRIEFDAGHGSGNRAQRIELQADEDAFCWSTLGLFPDPSAAAE